jgi:hypothetical protein
MEDALPHGGPLASGALGGIPDDFFLRRERRRGCVALGTWPREHPDLGPRVHSRAGDRARSGTLQSTCLDATVFKGLGLDQKNWEYIGNAGHLRGPISGLSTVRLYEPTGPLMLGRSLQ